MQKRIGELGNRLVMFAAAALVIGVTGVVLGVPGALDGEWTSIAAILAGLLGVASALMIWTGANAGSALDGMNLGVLWALANVPYVRIFDRDAGTDLEYPLPAFGVIYQMRSATEINGELLTEEMWGIGFLGVILLISALAVRKDWARVVERESVQRR